MIPEKPQELFRKNIGVIYDPRGVSEARRIATNLRSCVDDALKALPSAIKTRQARRQNRFPNLAFCGRERILWISKQHA
jgi:hypothetical protein